MKNFFRVTALVACLLFIVLGESSKVASAATSPSLGSATTYSVLSGAGATNGGAGTTTISGDFGVSPAASYTDVGTTVFLTPGNPHLADASAASAQFDQQAVFNGPLDSVAQPCDVTYAVTTDLSTVGPLDPGVYCTAPLADFTLSGTLTLNGTTNPLTDVWIFRSSRDLIGSGTANVVYTGTGGLACNVWWRVANTATFTANNAIVGNILAATSITFGQSATLDGRAFAFTGAVTLLGNTISGPTCAIPPATLNVVKAVTNDDGGLATAGSFNLHVKLGLADVVGSPAVGAVFPGTSYSLAPGTYTVSEDANALYTGSFSGDCNAAGSITLNSGDVKTCTLTNDDIAPLPATINVVKTVINDNGRTKVIADFPLFVNGAPVVSGVTNTFPAPLAYTITETLDPNYTRTFSGDCNASGNLTLSPGDAKTCIITNNDIAIPSSGGGGGGSVGLPTPPPVPPLIDVIKVPSPHALPDGPGLVKYTYTLTNIGTVPVTNITMVGDSCSPIVLDSGDINSDTKLDLNETWKYTCSSTLTETHTNTVVATGWSKGLTATDIASATVVVGAPIVPPLIHVTKVPSPLLLPAGGGWITYTEKITNPGLVPLSNVVLTDDKCAPMKYISGDSNNDSMLDTSETWTYTCSSNLEETTTNTAVAVGEANGITVRDFAIATVVVGPTVVYPKLPNTGAESANNYILWLLMIPAGLIAMVLTKLLCERKSQ